MSDPPPLRPRIKSDSCYTYTLNNVPNPQSTDPIEIDEASAETVIYSKVKPIADLLPDAKNDSKIVTISLPGAEENTVTRRRRDRTYPYAPTTLPNKYYEEFCIGNVATGEPPVLFYNVNDTPPIFTVLLFALQQIMVCTTCIIIDPMVVSDLICAQALAAVRVKLISTVLFVCGLATIVQSTLGVRLPLMQGASFAFLPPIVVFTQIYPCPELTHPSNMTSHSSRLSDHTGHSFAVHAGQGIEHEWEHRLAMVQGTLLIASFVQITLGITGLVGVLIQHVGPLTIAPLMLMLSFSQVQLCVNNVAKGWTSLLLIGLLLLTALYLQGVGIPVPVVDSSTGKVKITRKPVFALFPYLLATALVWMLSAVLTVTNVLPAGDDARTDRRTHVMWEAPWAAVPYPGQWSQGYKFHSGLFVGFLASTIASVVESIGDYHACARVTPAPPSHAVNRGILAEGFGCMMSALLGGGTSLTTYSECIGAIALTGVASRRILQAAGILLMLLGVFTKFGALLATIPDPLIGAQLTISLSMIAGVGLSSLTQCDMRCSRNMAIVGLACFAGVMIPQYIAQHPLWILEHATDTLTDAILQAINTLLQLQMFVAGSIGFILDNTVPGATRRQRGFRTPKKSMDPKGETPKESVYDLPEGLVDAIDRFFCLAHILPDNNQHVSEHT